MLNEALRLVRVFHDVNQSDLATELGVARSYISEIEHGKKQPSLETLQRYSDRFHIPVSSLLLFSENLQDGSVAVKARRLTVARKIVNILDWIAARDEDCNE